ncbi:MAG: helix-turn-helix transcriptional regulator [Desulfobacterales bacterium]|nr:helix-turn-helix transcriptional regulator [Desulfobacterales bacterium]
MSRKKSYSNKKSLGTRLKELRLSKKLTQQEFADTSGISQGYLANVEAGRYKPDGDILIRIANKFIINLDWLLTGEGEMEKAVGPPIIAEHQAPYTIPGAIPVRTIPVLGRVPAGFPDQVPVQEIIEYISCPDAQSGSYALIIKGDSMSPAIKDGDYVLFIPDGNINNGDVIVVNDEWGDSMIKRYRERDGDILLTSDNPEYPSFSPNEHYRIIGKVVGAWRKITV